MTTVEPAAASDVDEFAVVQAADERAQRFYAGHGFGVLSTQRARDL